MSALSWLLSKLRRRLPNTPRLPTEPGPWHPGDAACIPGIVEAIDLPWPRGLRVFEVERRNPIRLSSRIAIPGESLRDAAAHWMRSCDTALLFEVRLWAWDSDRWIILGRERFCPAAEPDGVMSLGGSL